MKRAAYALALVIAGGGFAACRDRGGGEPTPGALDPGGFGALAPTDDSLALECVTTATAPSTTSAPGAPAAPSTGSGSRLLFDEQSALPSEVSLVAVGDSLTYGQTSTHPGGDTSYPAVLGRLLGVPTVNLGVPGHTTSELPEVDYLLVPDRQNRLVVMIGTNDIHNGVGATAAETFAKLKTYVDARQAAGWLVTVITPPRWLASTPESDRVASEYEGMIRAGFHHVADAAASPLIGRLASDRAYYGDELGHLNDAGYAALAQIVRASPPPRGLAPVIAASMGVAPARNLTAWFRDWLQCTAAAEQRDRPVAWLNIANGGPSSGIFEAFGRDRATRIRDAINGRPALRFNGPGSGFFLPRDRLTRDIVRRNAFVISVVMNVERMSSSSSAPYDNDGVFSDSKTRLGMSVKHPNTVTAFTYDGSKWTRRDAELPVGVPVVVSMRLWNGKLGLRVHTTGAWSETPAPDIDSLESVFRIGTDSTNEKTFSGLIADVVVRRSYCDATMAADDEYFRARYGVR